LIAELIPKNLSIQIREVVAGPDDIAVAIRLQQGICELEPVDDLLQSFRSAGICFVYEIIKLEDLIMSGGDGGIGRGDGASWLPELFVFPAWADKSNQLAPILDFLRIGAKFGK